ncbi:hypothetical protein BC739_009417 [Kutzneria viridogrisea]|uniref:DUF6879 domain-containing protein n=1 Tax=Kutzneria viridogrisea TaxID=47990 RepID=A0ABR6BZ16_9PSEU|nr:hypothetical protein [Kutzneria viridogrisea]
MDLAELGRIGATATDQFRLETLPTYLVDEEAEDFAAWQRGNRTLLTVENDPWLQHIRDTTATGVHWWRARIVDYPLTDYSTYELHGYQANAAAGEDIYIADRAWSAELVELRDDFWIFDNEIVVRMIYDEDGRFVRPEHVTDTRHYLGLRSIAIRHAVPLAEFLNRNEPRLIA